MLLLLLTSFFFSAPAKPEKPTVEGTGADKVKVTYNFGLGGGYTHEFLVMYRRKCKHSILKGVVSYLVCGVTVQMNSRGAIYLSAIAK